MYAFAAAIDRALSGVSVASTLTAASPHGARLLSGDQHVCHAMFQRLECSNRDSELLTRL